MAETAFQFQTIFFIKNLVKETESQHIQVVILQGSQEHLDWVPHFHDTTVAGAEHLLVTCDLSNPQISLEKHLWRFVCLFFPFLTKEAVEYPGRVHGTGNKRRHCDLIPVFPALTDPAWASTGGISDTSNGYSTLSIFCILVAGSESLHVAQTQRTDWPHELQRTCDPA